MPGDPLDDLFWRDELLQILYWMRGEGLQPAASAAELAPFLLELEDEAAIRSHLERLVADGYAERQQEGDSEGGARYSLSEAGIREGARRFADAFDGLTPQGHGVCSNPRCDCHRLGPEACISSVPHAH